MLLSVSSIFEDVTSKKHCVLYCCDYPSPEGIVVSARVGVAFVRLVLATGGSFSYGSGSAIWNSTRDTATLKDGNGTLNDEYSY